MRSIYKPRQNIIMKGETRGMVTPLRGDFIYNLLDHVLEIFLEEGDQIFIKDFLQGDEVKSTDEEKA